MTYWLKLFGDIGIWGGTVVPLLFVLEYTFLSKWWKNPIGRSIVALDLALEPIMAPLWVSIMFPRWVHDHLMLFQWILVGGLVLIPVTLAYRMLVWYRYHRIQNGK